MISRRFSLTQKAAALAPVLLLLVYLPAQAMMRCRIDGLLRPTCCCPHDADKESAGPEMKAQDCCDRVVPRETQRPTAEAARPADRELSHAAMIALALPIAPGLGAPIERRDGAAQRQGPAREGPPLVLLKHAFLI